MDGEIDIYKHFTWLQRSQESHQATANNETYQDRLTRLEGDKESLILQVSVLTDQVEAQGEKIRDLEVCLEGHQAKLNATEEMLQQELLSRTSLETQKLDLMAEVSELKIKLVGMEKEQSEYEEKQSKAEELLQELRHLKIKVEELENERNQYEWKLKATKAEIAQLQEQLALKDAEIERLHSQISRSAAHNENPDREEGYRRRLKEKHQEVQRLKIGMETLLVANEEKDRRIQELTLLLSQYRRMKEIVIASHGSSERILSSSEEELEGHLKKWNITNKSPGELHNPEVSLGCSSPSSGAPPPLPQKTMDMSGSLVTPPQIPVGRSEEPLEIRSRVQKKLSNSLEDLHRDSLEKHVDEKHLAPVVEPEDKSFLEDNKYQTLPGKLSRALPNGDPTKHSSPAAQHGAPACEAEASSLPSLRETESSLDEANASHDLSPTSSGTESSLQSPLTIEGKRSPKGIKKFWGKIRRTQSGNFNTDELGIAEFRRGGLRATAGPRLSRPKDPKGQKSDANAPFAQWSTERVCAWLEDFGLGQYVIFARQWITSGHTLLTATPQDMEKELGIKHPLHRKKLVLAIKSINTKQEEKSAQLDHIWVTRECEATACFFPVHLGEGEGREGVCLTRGSPPSCGKFPGLISPSPTATQLTRLAPLILTFSLYLDLIYLTTDPSPTSCLWPGTPALLKSDTQLLSPSSTSYRSHISSKRPSLSPPFLFSHSLLRRPDLFPLFIPIPALMHISVFIYVFIFLYYCLSSSRL
uniref:PPFIA binding protein 2 n=1 Tax=Ornithorhynchus anatinus TaxID=9258 RepID=A0A6I8NJQ4_ORNAN